LKRLQRPPVCGADSLAALEEVDYADGGGRLVQGTVGHADGAGPREVVVLVPCDAA